MTINSEYEDKQWISFDSPRSSQPIKMIPNFGTERYSSRSTNQFDLLNLFLNERHLEIFRVNRIIA